MIDPGSKIHEITKHPEYEQYVKSVRANREKLAKEMGISYEEYVEKLTEGLFED